MKLKNSLPLSIFGLIIVLVVFYTFKDQKSSRSIKKSNYELSFEDDNYQEQNYQQHEYSRNKNKRLKKESVKKLKNFRLSMNKQKASAKFTDAPVKETPTSDEEEAQKTAQNEEDKSDEDEEKEDEEKEDKEEDVAESDNSDKTPIDNKKLEDFESVEASSFDDPIFIGSNTNLLNNSQDELEDTEGNSQNVAQGSSNPTGFSDEDGDNEGFGEVDLSQLSEMIEENKFEEIQFLINSSSLSTFRREALQILVTNSASSENSAEIGSILIATYFTTSHLGLFTQSMVEDGYSTQEKAYMGTLILQNLTDASKRMRKAEFVDLYFNGVRALLPTPENVDDPALSELYLTIDYAIEENFSLYTSNSQVAVSQ